MTSPTTDDMNKYDEQQNTYREDKEEYPLLQIIGIFLALMLGGIVFWFVFIH